MQKLQPILMLSLITDFVFDSNASGMPISAFSGQLSLGETHGFPFPTHSLTGSPAQWPSRGSAKVLQVFTWGSTPVPLSSAQHTTLVG